ncbi:GNAT family N-acetyltransferase [Micrococcus sp.]|uniref:GNAT family N-acetyltransferase n=1 Tax=Micrococcus sp. TaxID=1271 RepID=UPI002A91DF51|nr:GNAT family N-acetyltransferase [Micrococcus sp.]MDY6055320.1 GNAT family N-acetyltransferase [Micrococcus sp.]
MPPRSASTDALIRRATQGRVRLLTDEDTPALAALAARDAVVNVHAQALLEVGRLAGPRGTSRDATGFLGVSAESDAGPGAPLRSAAWVGSTVVPLAGHDDDGPALGAAVASLRRRLASVYGPAPTVLAVGRALREAGQRPRAVRPDQPLLVAPALGEAPDAPEPSADVVVARPEHLDRVLPASAAMFEEELGFSPFLTGAAQYTDRVRRLVADGRVFVDLDDTPGRDPWAPLRFKADIGVLSRACAQIQGVWMRPQDRGRGLAAPAMAAVVELARRRAPAVSLYVNAFNTPALRTYRRVGFTRHTTFATVLF